ncbi:putative CFEM domain-containing protein, partial [Colletotrichum incanum]
ALFILQILYHTLIAVIKASILFLFIRIFPGEKFRLMLRDTQVFNYSRPLSLTLSPFLNILSGLKDPGRKTALFQHAPRGFACGLLNIVLDVWMFALPFSQVLGLNMKWRNKFAVIPMFNLGILQVYISERLLPPNYRHQLPIRIRHSAPSPTVVSIVHT